MGFYLKNILILLKRTDNFFSEVKILCDIRSYDNKDEKRKLDIV